MPDAPSTQCQVIVIGGGPCGLMLANELGRRGVSVVMIDQKAGIATNPQANATQARTMEHYRRLGFVEEVRSLGLPADFPTDVAYFTRFAGHELARFALPSAREAKARILASSAGSGSAAEPPHRVSQKFVEAVLRRHAERLESVRVRYGVRLVDFSESADGVEACVESVDTGLRQTLRGDYLVGADGPRSLVRQRLGVRYSGETTHRDFFGGPMYAVYLHCPRYYEVVPHRPAWMNVTFNRERRAFMAAVDGRGEFAFHTQLRAHEHKEALSDADALSLFQAAAGVAVPAEILSRDSWTAGHALVAERFQHGRIFLGGDAVHLFTPTGGLGYNTAVEDAVNLGWKLAMVLGGRASPQLLDSYELERRPLALRNTRYARRFADSLGMFEPAPQIEEDSEAGHAARMTAGRYLEAHGRSEFNIPGITFGGRYDGSPAIVPDGTAPPADRADVYVATATPGGRPPHLWLEQGVSLYDLFGFEFTLLRLGRSAPAADAFVQAARQLRIDLKVVDVALQQARDLYEADLVVIRPDHVVGWRGNDSGAAADVLARLSGRWAPERARGHGD